jgi:DNA polymerase-3 subunit epsilon
VSRWSLRLRVFLFFALIAGGTIAALAVGFVHSAREVGPEARPALVLAFGGAGFAIVGLVLWVWQQFDEHVAKPIVAIGRDVRAVVHAGARGGELQHQGRYLGFLAPAVAEVAAALERARADTEERIREATAEAHRQRARLEAVLRDLTEGVVICNLDHEILLYNQRASEILHDCGHLGLGRPIGGLVGDEPFRFALERLRRRFVEDRWSDHPDGLTTLAVASTRHLRATLKARVALTLDAEASRPVGYVVAFDDATEEIEAAAERDRRLHEGAEDVRRRVADVTGLSELALRGQADGEEREAVARELERARGTVSAALDRLDTVTRDGHATPWPTAPIYASTLIAFLGDRVAGACALNTAQIPGDLWVRCDGASMLALLAHLVRRLAAERTHQVLVEMRASPHRVVLDLVWQGRGVDERELDAWLGESLGEGFAGLTGREVLARHKTALWGVARKREEVALRLPLARGEPAGRRPRTTAPTFSARPEFYDFDLFARHGRSALMEAPLRRLTYVVFDTETTGLEPQGDDEIVSIAGVRIVNARVLTGEIFDRFVHPGRRIPPASTRVHGISDEQVKDAPPLDMVVPDFHAYVGEAVLVAHNAAFDMSFLSKHQRRLGVAFTQPVLDTVLLAAHVFGPGERLTLDALVERFEIALPEHERHTALGDARATAYVFLRLIALLEADGTRTLGDALRASEQQVALRRRQGVYQSG